jgi:hypothetical protein
MCVCVCVRVCACVCVREACAYSLTRINLSNASHNNRYTNGASCPSGSGDETHQTTILFECSEEAGDGTPVMDTSLSTTCHAYLRWASKHACTHIHECNECLVDDSIGHQFDLSVLTRTPGQGNWIVRSTDG